MGQLLAPWCMSADGDMDFWEVVWAHLWHGRLEERQGLATVKIPAPVQHGAGPGRAGPTWRQDCACCPGWALHDSDVDLKHAARWDLHSGLPRPGPRAVASIGHSGPHSIPGGPDYLGARPSGREQCRSLCRNGRHTEVPAHGPSGGVGKA